MTRSRNKEGRGLYLPGYRYSIFIV